VQAQQERVAETKEQGGVQKVEEEGGEVIKGQWSKDRSLVKVLDESWAIGTSKPGRTVW
jgi:hypothetical protein